VNGSGVAAVLTAAVEDGKTPGAVFLSGGAGQPAQAVVAGQAQVYGGPARPMHRDTLFDLASLTKVVATLPVILRLAERGELAIDHPVARFLPGFSGGRRDEITVRQLLAHTSGLPAVVEFWQLYTDSEQAALAMLEVPLERLLVQAARADRIIKGLAVGDAWSAITALAAELAGALQGTPDSGRVLQ